MRINKVYIDSFKNLKQFSIDLDETQMNTILLGQNATGKSNFMEALILIFKYLDLGKTPTGNDYFDYRIEYNCRMKNINVQLKNRKYVFKVAGKEVAKSKFYSNKDYLPKYVFTYYSGLSNRLYELFWDHQKRFYDNIIKKDFDRKDVDSLRRLFYVQQVHSYFVLLAFYSFKSEEDKSRDFLKKVLNIIDIESLLFVLKKAASGWKGDVRFWGAEGLVKEFLSSVWKYALAPIYHKESVQIDFRHKVSRETLYLYISDKNKLSKFVKEYLRNIGTRSNNTNLFKALESTYISELLEGIRIKVKKEIDGEITFKELSEGEQQLLTVLGLLKFTKDEESLVLLDEPDTHLNPIWKWEYLEFLNDVFRDRTKKELDTTQVIINSHDPLVIGSLEKNQVQVFKRNSETGHITAEEPDVSPRGLGVAGILTSELFGLPTILDKETQKQLNRKRYLQGKVIRKDISRAEYKEYQELKAKLEEYGFYEEVEDQWFKWYLAEMSKHEIIQKVEYTRQEKEEIEKISKQAVKNVLKRMKAEASS